MRPFHLRRTPRGLCGPRAAVRRLRIVPHGPHGRPCRVRHTDSRDLTARLQRVINQLSEASDLTSLPSGSNSSDHDPLDFNRATSDARASAILDSQFEQRAMDTVGLTLEPARLAEEDTDVEGYAGDGEGDGRELSEGSAPLRPRKRRKHRPAVLPHGMCLAALREHRSLTPHR